MLQIFLQAANIDEFSAGFHVYGSMHGRVEVMMQEIKKIGIIWPTTTTDLVNAMLQANKAKL